MEMRRQTRPHRPDCAVWRRGRGDEGAGEGVGVSSVMSKCYWRLYLLTILFFVFLSEGHATEEKVVLKYETKNMARYSVNINEMNFEAGFYRHRELEENAYRQNTMNYIFPGGDKIGEY